MRILVTGCAGFIGYHLCKDLLINNKNSIFGIDNLNNYYDVTIKKNRLKKLKVNKKFFFYKIDIKNEKKLKNFFEKNRFDVVIHLAAQAGVRYSIENPKTYIQNNINGFFNVIDLSTRYKIKHFIYASTSSVYGNTKKFPIKETDNTDFPLSLYAATKKSNEVIAYSYSNIFGLATTGLRFFTVYGPFGRPDMFLYKYVDSIFNKKKFKLHNYGKHIRDFTYISDVTGAIIKLINSKSSKKIPYQVFNIGNGNPQKLMKFIKYIEKILNFKPLIQKIKKQKGDVYKTHSDINLLQKRIAYKPSRNTLRGINNFIEWYKKYYRK